MYGHICDTCVIWHFIELNVIFVVSFLCNEWFINDLPTIMIMMSTYIYIFTCYIICNAHDVSLYIHKCTFVFALTCVYNIVLISKTRRNKYNH